MQNWVRNHQRNKILPFFPYFCCGRQWFHVQCLIQVTGSCRVILKTFALFSLPDHYSIHFTNPICPGAFGGGLGSGGRNNAQMESQWATTSRPQHPVRSHPEHAHRHLEVLCPRGGPPPLLALGSMPPRGSRSPQMTMISGVHYFDGFSPGLLR